MAACTDLGGLPVVCAELHSMVPVVAAAARVAGDLRVAYVMTDGGALPLAFSRLAAELRAGGLVGTITAGQAFGGDLEAISLYSALAAARAVLAADVVVVAQGPGGMGSGTALGFSGTQVAEAVNAAAALGGRPVACLRLSAADRRPRHRGVSHQPDRAGPPRPGPRGGGRARAGRPRAGRAGRPPAGRGGGGRPPRPAPGGHPRPGQAARLWGL